MSKVLDFAKGNLVLGTHHIRDSIRRQIDNGHLSIYSVTKADLFSNDYINRTLARAEKEEFPVLLKVRGVTRLLIFNRKV